MKFIVKVWKNFRWKKRQLLIREKEQDFQIKKIDKPIKKKKTKEDEIHTYALINAIIIDQSKKNELQILIATKDYKQYLKPYNVDDKLKIIRVIGDIIKANTFQNAYKEYNEKVAQFNVGENEMNPQDFLCCKLFLFRNLMTEMNQKIEDFNNLVKLKLKSKTETEIIRIINNINTIKTEMDSNFQQILTYINKIFDINENARRNTIRLNTIFADSVKVDTLKEGKKIEESETIDNENSSDEEENLEKTTDDRKYSVEANNDNNNENINNINNENVNNNSQYKFLSYNQNDFKNALYNFDKRTKYNKTIMYPQNIVKEMIQSMTQNKPAPVYFNEPLSMGQRQCEKFYYLNLLNKVSQENNNKSLQLGYISAFIIGEIFLSLNRNLKPFNPIIGETYEYFDNENNFRYYSEQVSHKPQITAFIGETPDYALYGDTNNSTSFKILKGAMELSFKNKIHLHIKANNDHFVYNRPNIMVKGLLKPPLHNDYNGTTIIENKVFPEHKAEIKFIEESWTNSTLGLFEGKITCGEEVIYLIKGNWKNSIYLIDVKDDNKKIELLNIDQNQDYLKNGMEGEYNLPKFCYNLNYINKSLEEDLPGNDSRFRKDIRFLEECPDTKDAQLFKEKYEEKQRKELNNENHKILFFDENIDEEDEKYYIPNGKYWEMKKSGELKNNCNCKIFDVTNYMK
jgi:hypothetical protein